MKYTVLLVGFSLLFIACSTNPKGAFIPPTKNTPTPNYANKSLWAALPDRQDEADNVPKGNFQDQQATAEADIFWLYPTTYTGKKGQDQWYAPLDDEYTNTRTDETSIKFQASIFNAAGRVFAPRYRQMHLHGFYTKKEAMKAEGTKAYKLAYQDIKSAFEYYLKHYNNGRPIIIAAHSQGAGHGITLVKEFFDGTDLQQQFVAAYLVGWPVRNDEFKTIKGCTSPTDINCICSWRTFKNGHFPDENTGKNGEYIVTNPLSWTMDDTLVPKTENDGGVLLDLNVIYPELADAKIQDGVLWTHKPKFPGSFFIWRKNYHVADLNFYWVDVRKNAVARVQAFLKR
jgi:hypothetical protein